MEENNSGGGPLSVMNRGKTWLRHMLNVPHLPSTGEGLEGGSPDFSSSPCNFNVIKRGSLTTQDLQPGAVLLGYDHKSASRRGSDFKSLQDYSEELVKAEDIQNDELKIKLDHMSATLKEYEEHSINKSDEEIFSLDIDVSGLNSKSSEAETQLSRNTTLLSNQEERNISRFLPNHWLFAKEEDNESTEEEKSKARKTSDGRDPKIQHPITQTAKAMLEKRELNVLLPQGM